ncbi:formate hydrogenase [Leptospira fletcheri]|uniref:Formate hydrogenase n=1 Tax=Leptospira fletcheri TaxID=2484981 RepID=A0A4R9GBX8_9LEPT|nr:formate hydrogenase [Leptospira fletcheri]TGK08650.1 formate hydrogenase [Leptospira fletcheri]
MATDFSYLIILLTGVVALLENRLKRLVILIGIQGFLLLIPLYQEEKGDTFHSVFLALMVIIFKGLLTPAILYWTARRTNSAESTYPKVGYFPTLILLFIGAVVSYTFIGVIHSFFGNDHPYGFHFVLLLIYVGLVGFVVRRNWFGIVACFSIFENGIFLLTLLLKSGVPLGSEFGSFIDAVLIIGAGAALRINSEKGKEETSA